MPNITLTVRACHFKGANFKEPCLCALSNAAKEHFGVKKIAEAIYRLRVNAYTKRERFYLHECYDDKDFDTDMSIATAANFDDTIIRTIELIPA